MHHQISENLRLFTSLAVTTVLVVFASVATAAETDDESLKRAVQALESSDYEKALALLDEAQPSELDARVNYYRGFAFEKIGECNAARRQYQMASSDAERPRLQGFARKALDGFDGRCKAPVVSVDEIQPVASSPGVGWQIFGWVTLTVGTLALVAVPVKNSIETSALEQATPYFSERYDCSVNRDGVSGVKCDREGLESDPAYSDYRDRVELADRTSTYLLVGGLAVAGVGLTTILIDSLAGSSPASASVAPTQDGGFAATLRVDF